MQLKKFYPLDEQVRLEVTDFHCQGAYVPASAFLPEVASALGVVFVVGAPQYRVGTHRQYFELAHSCARAGHPALIFDPRGLGDSEGRFRPYYLIQDDIRSAIEALYKVSPGLQSLMLFGLCDGATAALLYAADDSRVSALFLVNLWLEATRSQARFRLKEYYGARLASRAFWLDLLRGRLNTGRSIGGIISEVGRALAKPLTAGEAAPSPEDVAHAAAAFKGNIHLVLSERDVTARVCSAELETNKIWNVVRKRSSFTRHDVVGADHTLSRSAWHDELVGQLASFLSRCESDTVNAGRKNAHLSISR